jgi:hypothetical protein
MRRGGREAEGGGLLIRYRGITSIQGSNPCLSAILWGWRLLLFTRLECGPGPIAGRGNIVACGSGRLNSVGFRKQRALHNQLTRVACFCYLGAEPETGARPARCTSVRRHDGGRGMLSCPLLGQHANYGQTPKSLSLWACWQGPLLSSLPSGKATETEGHAGQG